MLMSLVVALGRESDRRKASAYTGRHNNTEKRGQAVTSIPQAGLQPVISVFKWSMIYAGVVPAPGQGDRAHKQNPEPGFVC
jgi:hypothetical protein